MANKYIELSSGQLAEREGLVTSAGAGDAGKIVATDSTGRIDSTLLPVGVTAETTTATATEALAAGDFVNIYDSTGLKVRKADASGGNAKKAHGYVLAAVSNGGTATIYYGNLNNLLSGLTVGATYYLSGTTPGEVTTTAPTTAAYIVQQLGTARSATEMLVEIQSTITRA